MLYLYGIVRSGHPAPRTTGVGSPPRKVVLVESGRLAVAATKLPDDFEVQEEDARTHLDVLVRLMRSGPVIPLRMGTVAPDDEAVKLELLDSAAPQLNELLDALDGLVELHVDADDDETEAIAAIARTTDIGATRATDVMTRLEVGREIAQLLVDRRRQLAEEIVSELRPFAVDDVPRSSLQGPEDPVLRWAFLVKRDEVENFDDAVVAVQSHHPKAVIRYVGPLPPAHFIDRLQSEEAEASPADSFSAETNWRW